MEAALTGAGQQRRTPGYQAGYGTGRAAGYVPVPAGVPSLTPEQESILLEHLPVVRFLARRIHERLPQHVDM